MKQAIQESTDAFQAIAHPNRRKLLDLLLEEERCVQDLVPHLGITVGAVSQHLKILHDSGLVAWRKEGRFRFYRTRPQRLKDVYEWVERYRQHWEGSLDRLGAYLDKKK